MPPHSLPTRPTAATPELRGGTWHLRLLGSFELSDGVERHHKLGTRAAMALLARLALQPGQSHPREALVELLWPEAPPEAGRQRLRQTLSTLKQVLEPASRPGGAVLDADRLAIRLVPASLHCDALAFEQACQRGAHDEAHALYAGELMPGFFDEWIHDERLRLEGLFDRLRPPSPPPSDATREAATRRGKAAPSTGPRGGAMPAYLTRMIGADPQATRLRQEVLGHRLVTLLGPGGTGKTRLAVEVAQALSRAPAWSALGGDGTSFDSEPAGGFDIVGFVPLEACRSEAQLLDQALLSLHLTSGPHGSLETLLQALDGRPALLVLDNFEQVVDAGAQVVAELVSRLPRLHLLVTSRRVLGLAGEREVVAQALALPPADLSLAEAALNPAVALFVDRARAARAEFSLHAHNRAAVIEVVQLLDGMPLAIELAAARVRSLGPAEMALTLRQAREGRASALDLLARAARRGRPDTRHHSMQETIHWSWQLLGPELRELLAAVTVFQGGFSAEAARAVAAASPAQAAAVPWQLDELLSHSLLRAVAAPDDDTEAGVGSDVLRYSLYEPIREFAQRTLQPDDAATLRRRHRAWAEAWGRAMPATPPLAALRTELPNLTAAMASAVSDGEPGTALAIMAALQPALDFVCLPGAVQVALEAAMVACNDPERRSAASVLLGFDMFRSGRGDAGRQMIERGIASMPADQPGHHARGLIVAVILAWNSGERGPGLLQRLDQAQALAQASADPSLLGREAGVRADIVGIRDREFERARALHEQALGRWQALGNGMAVLRTRYSLAQLAYLAGEHEAMFAQLEPLLVEARRLQWWSVVAASLTLRSAAHEDRRRWPAAQADARDSLRTAWLALDSWNTALAMWSLLRPMARIGQVTEAQQLAGFISRFWVQRYGPVNAVYGLSLRRVRRIARARLGDQASTSAFTRGEALSAAQAVALALETPAPNRSATA